MSNYEAARLAWEQYSEGLQELHPPALVALTLFIRHSDPSDELLGNLLLVHNKSYARCVSSILHRNGCARGGRMYKAKGV